MRAIIELNIKERNKSTLISFLLKWNTYKKVTPEELHSFFIEVMKEIKNLNDEEIAEIIRGIQSQIRNNHKNYQ